MTKTARARYTLEFKQEAVRLVEGGQSIAAAARALGIGRSQEPSATLEFERILHVDNGLPVHEGVTDGEATACLPVLDALMDRC